MSLDMKQKCLASTGCPGLRKRVLLVRDRIRGVISPQVIQKGDIQREDNKGRKPEPSLEDGQFRDWQKTLR